MSSPAKPADGGVPITGPSLESGPFYPSDGCCTICFMDLSVTRAIQFQCQHVICATCVLQMFSETKLAECGECSTPCSRQRAALMVGAAAEADSSTLADIFPGKTKEELVSSIGSEASSGASSSTKGASGGEASLTTEHASAMVARTDFGDATFMNLVDSTPYSMSVSEAASKLAEACTNIRSQDPEIVARAAFMIRKALSSTTSPPCEEVIAAGVVPRLVELMSSSGDVRTVFEATWAVTNVASGTSEQTRHVVNCGAVPILLDLLSSSSAEVREQSIWCLGNICGDGPDLRDMCIGQGIAGHIVTLLSSQQLRSSSPFRRNTVWAASNVCRGKPQPPFETMQVLVPALAEMLLDDDEEVLCDSCWALSYASDGPNERIQLLLDCGMVERIVELAMHSSTRVITPALRVMGNIVTGDDGQTAAALSAGCVPVLVGMLGNSKESIRKEASWTLSNIFAGTQEQIQVCIDAGCLPLLLSLIQGDSARVGKEALWAIANALSGCSASQALALQEEGVASVLVGALTADDSLVSIAADAIVNLTGHLPDSVSSLIDADLESAVEQIAGSHPDAYDKLIGML